MTDARQVIAGVILNRISLRAIVAEVVGNIVERLAAACPGDYIVIRKADWKLMGLEFADAWDDPGSSGVLLEDDPEPIPAGAPPLWRLIDPEGGPDGE